jgi:hypothetical protein
MNAIKTKQRKLFSKVCEELCSKECCICFKNTQNKTYCEHSVWEIGNKGFNPLRLETM